MNKEIYNSAVILHIAVTKTSITIKAYAKCMETYMVMLLCVYALLKIKLYRKSSFIFFFLVNCSLLIKSQPTIS